MINKLKKMKKQMMKMKIKKNQIWKRKVPKTIEMSKGMQKNKI